MQNKKSFTLIEMLIVVVIIGILAAALIPRLQSVQARARDTKRKADLHQIATALEVYKQDNGGFQTYNSSFCWGIPVRWLDPKYYANTYFTQTILPRYMTSIPADSDGSQWISNTDVDCGIVQWYIFITVARNGNHHAAFVLAARTESDGGSSNRVSDVTQSPNPNSDHYPLRAGDSSTPRVWELIWTYTYWAVNSYGQPDDRGTNTINANVFETNMCASVTFSGWTDNLSDTCSANKNSSNAGWDLRYIYVQ